MKTEINYKIIFKNEEEEKIIESFIVRKRGPLKC